MNGVGRGLPKPLARLWEWLALSGDRRVVTGLLLVVGFAQTVAIGLAVTVPRSAGLATENTAIPLASALLSGTLLLFSIVVSVNSLYVSQQQNPLGQQFDRIQGILEFRLRLEDVMGVDHVPAQPEQLLRPCCRARSSNARSTSKTRYTPPTSSSSATSTRTSTRWPRRRAT